jgi:hypothetical protein
MFKDTSGAVDPSLVTDAFVNLAYMTPGTRPFRTVVGIDFGVSQMNAATAPFDAATVEALGLKEFTTLKT